MSSNVLTSRLPWQDRWSEPTLLQLLEPMKIQYRRLFEQLMAELAEFDHLEQDIFWYGRAWNWTILYRLTGPLATTLPNGSLIHPSSSAGKGSSHDASRRELVYLVPRVETPIICVPLSEPVIDQLPMKRLNRFIRDGIKAAKHAVAIHWATWTPSSKAEVTYLADLLKRKQKLLLEPGVKAAPAAPAEGDAPRTGKADTPRTKAAGKGKSIPSKAKTAQTSPPPETPETPEAPEAPEALADKPEAPDKGNAKGKAGKTGKAQAAASRTTRPTTKADKPTADVKTKSSSGASSTKTAKAVKTAKATSPKAGKASAAPSVSDKHAAPSSASKTTARTTTRSPAKPAAKTTAKGSSRTSAKAVGGNKKTASTGKSAGTPASAGVSADKNKARRGAASSSSVSSPRKRAGKAASADGGKQSVAAGAGRKSR